MDEHHREEENKDLESSTHEENPGKKRSCFQSLLSHFISLISNCGGLCVFVLTLSVSLSLMIAVFLASSPILLVILLLTRFIQMFKNGENYDTVVKLKIFIRTGIFMGMFVAVTPVAIFYGIAKYVHILKHSMILGTSLPNWIVNYFVVFGIYYVNLILSAVVFSFPLYPLDCSQSGLQVPESVIEIIDCLTCWLAMSEVMKRVPYLKEVNLVGLETRKWAKILIFTLIGHNVITLCTHSIMLGLRFLTKTFDPGSDKNSVRYQYLEKMMHRKYILYYANGMKYSIDFILTSTMLLTIWVKYFKSHLDVTGRAQKVYDIGTWTCVSLLVCSFFWLIKTCLLLYLAAERVYNRLEEEILEGGKQLYFLGIIGRRTFDIFHLQLEQTIKLDFSSHWNMLLRMFPMVLMNRYSGNKQKELVKSDLIMKIGTPTTLYSLQQIAHYFVKARDMLTNNYNLEILEDLRENCTTSSMQKANRKEIDEIKFKKFIEVDCSSDDSKCSNVENDNSQIRKATRTYSRIISFGLNPTDDDATSDWHDFKDQVCENNGDTTSLFNDIRNWLERVHNHCSFLANTLVSTKELIDVLNKIISSIIIGATFILWLFLTGFATTRVLVLIASPLLATTFIFGDTCKNIFQGIMFAYMASPFDIGDLCVIDGNMMEVRRLGIWLTTFSKVGTHEEVIYPTSQLSTKNIINYRTNFYCYDRVEIEISKSLHHGQTIDDFKTKILSYLNGHKDKYTNTYIGEYMIDGNTKIVLNFRHNMKKNKKQTYSQFYKEKSKLASRLACDLQNLVNEGAKSVNDIPAPIDNKDISGGIVQIN